MTMCMSSPKVPAPPPPPPPPPELPKEMDVAARTARSNERQRAALAAGRASTILTGPLGASDTAATTAAGKTLLGQ
jgi:hypothetical protein